MTQRILIAFYSMTGNTRRIAAEIRAAVGAEIEEIREPRPRNGLRGVFRALFDSILRRKPPIQRMNCNPSDFDALIIGGPIWAGRMAAPVRSYAYRYGQRSPRVAFFCTEGGRGGATAFTDLQEICQRKPSATLEIDARHLDSAAHQDALQRFTAQLKASTTEAIT